MDDGIRLYFRDHRVNHQLRQEFSSELTEHTNKKTRTKNWTFVYRHLHITLYDAPYFGIRICGSIHRFFVDGKNNGLFTFEMLKIAIARLSEELHIDLDLNCLKKLETGVNIPCDTPEELLDAAVLYNSRKATTIIHKRRCYYKEWKFEDYIVKLYCKGSKLVRYEVRYESLDKLKAPITSLSDLLVKDNYVMCLDQLHAMVRLFTFVPVLYSNESEEGLVAQWANWQNDDYWKKLSPKQRYNERREIEGYIQKDSNLMDWGWFIEEGTIEQGATMLGVTYNQMLGMISALRLPPETVAGTARPRDRQTEHDPEVMATIADISQNTFASVSRLPVPKVAGPTEPRDCNDRNDDLSDCTNPVPQHRGVIITGCLWDVIILAASYPSIYARGPPVQR